jgi:hypothetical protein
MQMTDTNWNTLIISLGGLLTTIITGIVAILLAKINRTAIETKEAANKAAVKVEEVKTALKASDAHTDEKLDDIHTLVNSNFGVQLKISAIALRRLAGLTKDADDIAAAATADKALVEHERKQRIVDSGV